MVKYELLPSDKTINYVSLHRIRALTNFGDVKEGDIGGYVQDRDNLDHNTNAWIYDDAVVMDASFITKDAKIKDTTFVYGTSKIDGKITINGNATINNSTIFDTNSSVFHFCGYSKSIVRNVKILSKNTLLRGQFNIQGGYEDNCNLSLQESEIITNLDKELKIVCNDSDINKAITIINSSIIANGIISGSNILIKNSQINSTNTNSRLTIISDSLKMDNVEGHNIHIDDAKCELKDILISTPLLLRLKENVKIEQAHFFGFGSIHMRDCELQSTEGLGKIIIESANDNEIILDDLIINKGVKIRDIPDNFLTGLIEDRFFKGSNMYYNDYGNLEIKDVFIKKDEMPDAFILVNKINGKISDEIINILEILGYSNINLLKKLKVRELFLDINKKKICISDFPKNYENVYDMGLGVFQRYHELWSK